MDRVTIDDSPTREVSTPLIDLLKQLGAELTPPNPADECQAYCCEISGPFSPDRFDKVREALRPHFTEVGDWAKKNEDGRMRHSYLLQRPTA